MYTNEPEGSPATGYGSVPADTGDPVEAVKLPSAPMLNEKIPPLQSVENNTLPVTPVDIQHAPPGTVGVESAVSAPVVAFTLKPTIAPAPESSFTYRYS